MCSSLVRILGVFIQHVRRISSNVLIRVAAYRPTTDVTTIAAVMTAVMSGTAVS